MNWGKKITVLYIGFVLMILSLVGLTMNQKVELVSPDYYEQELSYQKKIDKINRTQQLSSQLYWETNVQTIVLKFPAPFKNKFIQGTVYFFRPSDASKDVIIPVTADSTGIQTIDKNKLHTGVYKMQIDWQANDEEYYNEGVIHVN